MIAKVWTCKHGIIIICRVCLDCLLSNRSGAHEPVPQIVMVVSYQTKVGVYSSFPAPVLVVSNSRFTPPCHPSCLPVYSLSNPTAQCDLDRAEWGILKKPPSPPPNRHDSVPVTVDTSCWQDSAVIDEYGNILRLQRAKINRMCEPLPKTWILFVLWAHGPRVASVIAP